MGTLSMENLSSEQVRQLAKQLYVWLIIELQNNENEASLIQLQMSLSCVGAFFFLEEDGKQKRLTFSLLKIQYDVCTMLYYVISYLHKETISNAEFNGRTDDQQNV